MKRLTSLTYISMAATLHMGGHASQKACKKVYKGPLHKGIITLDTLCYEMVYLCLDLQTKIKVVLLVHQYLTIE